MNDEGIKEEYIKINNCNKKIIVDTNKKKGKKKQQKKEDKN